MLNTLTSSSPGAWRTATARAVILSLALMVSGGLVTGCALLGGGGVKPKEYAGKPFPAQIGFQNVKIGVIWVGYEDAAVVIVDNKNKILFKQMVPRPVSQNSYELTLDGPTETLQYSARSYRGLTKTSSDSTFLSGKVTDDKVTIRIPESLVHPERARAPGTTPPPAPTSR
ncbi:MAG: hypothetical protein K8T26_14985 [Lentisphaerae bacterium]|nr:hypothetical protein [Lentisphaerota bacterium]